MTLFPKFLHLPDSVIYFVLFAAGTDEFASLAKALELIKHTIAQVNAQVKEHEKAARVREIGQRLDPKSVGRLNGDLVIRREDLIQGNRKLVHEGAVTWKSSGKQKGVERAC